MIISSARITALVLFMVIGAVSVSPIMGQQRTPSKIPPLRIIKYDGDMASLLAVLSKDFGVTIGLEIAPKQLQPRVSLYVKDATLADILNAIVKSAPAYEWRERNGCIEVLPVEGSNPFLDTMINSFQVTEVDHTEAVNRLLNLPDVQANLTSMSLTRKELSNTSATRAYATRTGKLSVKLEGVTVRQALSTIANESRARFWIFQPLGNGLFTISNEPMY